MIIFPELASSIFAAGKNEHEIALGNFLGSNLFNSLLVFDVAGFIRFIDIKKELINRDYSVMLFLTVSLFIIGYGFKSVNGIINRWEGLFLLLFYVFYITRLLLNL